MSKQLYKVQITNHCEAVLRDTAYSIAVDLSAPEEANFLGNEDERTDIYA